MERFFCWLAVTLVFATGYTQVGSSSGKRDFERYAQEQEEAFNAYLKMEEEEFKNYNDSINREFGI